MTRAEQVVTEAMGSRAPEVDWTDMDDARRGVEALKGADAYDEALAAWRDDFEGAVGYHRLMGASIKTGTTGRRPTVTEVVWRGTAECTVYGFERLPVALVDTDSGRRAIIQYEGQWWDARCLPSREWEHDDGTMVSGKLAAEIDALLADLAEHHARTSHRLNHEAARAARES
jgi:hypothetical protein